MQTRLEGARTVRPRKVVFLVGSGSGRANGVKDHAENLAAALRERDIAVDIVEVDWRSVGVIRAAARIVRAMRNGTDHVVIHYSHLGWSKRGLPIGTIAVAALTRLFCPGTVWVHDPDRIGDARPRHRAASLLKANGLRLAIRIAGTGVTSVHPSRVFWASERIRPRLAFCPTPSNVGAADTAPPADRFTVSFFGISAATDPAETEAITDVVDELRGRVTRLRVRVLGASSVGDAAALSFTFRKLGVEADVPGYLEANELCAKLAASHAFVVLREPLSSRSGTIGAAIACGLPVVGYEGTETGPPLDGAGVIAVPNGDRAAIVDSLVRLEQSPEFRAVLSLRSASVAKRVLNWRVTAEVVDKLLTESASGRAANDSVGFDDALHN